VIELGNPLPDARYTPDRQRVGACPAAHNRALLGEGDCRSPRLMSVYMT
jgi:hypothetical protein